MDDTAEDAGGMAASEQTRDHRFPCDTCGADMRFDPGTGTMLCDHCGNTAVLNDRAPVHPIAELDFRAATRKALPEAEFEETRVDKCPNCGAEVEVDEKIHATECPFCATPLVTDTGVHRHIKPRGVLPFVLSETVARQAMTDWLGRLWFAPGGLKDYARKGRRMQGIYVPYWTFDADTRSAYSGERGTVYFETVTVVRDGKRMRQQVPRVRWRPASGRVARFFDDVLVLASKSLPKTFTDALQPWDLSGLQPYAPEFLAGFRAEGYGVTLEEGFTEAREIMDRVIARDVRFDIGGDRQRVHDIRTEIGGITFKHVLLPVWLAAYKFRGRTYRFVVNGQTGKVQGERPYSKIKVAFAVILGLLAAALIGYGMAQQ
ncbi:TFIIB-type zinc finger domain-containing protein [Sulfitobacter sp. D35]|uniref:TFIIB-type zinc finger domain-containing protein n=1 Tax=Sulfitobacter sp. D35 TaxID=3083252 RepID=UPI00296F22FB|nr:TFIIB-type zinc finger domain-containing protein [Sulfitobacter sp. D35]MDW4499835.1 TFIIB-type zinc finger domain-containing protein [Sulfitobacter sp. D35]